MKTQSKKLEGRVAIVTGASIAPHLAAEGALQIAPPRVVRVARPDGPDPDRSQRPRAISRIRQKARRTVRAIPPSR